MGEYLKFWIAKEAIGFASAIILCAILLFVLYKAER